MELAAKWLDNKDQTKKKMTEINNWCRLCNTDSAGLGIDSIPLCIQCRARVALEMSRIRRAGQPVNVRNIVTKLFKKQHKLASLDLKGVRKKDKIKFLAFCKQYNMTAREMFALLVTKIEIE